MDRIFKHKKDFLSSGDINMRSLAAVGKKLERDYLRFFNGLYKLYEKGEKKDELNYVVGKIKRAITTIDNIFSSGDASKKDVEKLLTEINEINESKEVFIDEIKDTKGLKERVKKITEVTGVSTEDLNVTEDIVKESIATGSKKTKKPVSKAMPRTSQVLQDIKPGVKGALFGPFSPLFDVAAGAFKDIRGWMKSRKEKKDEGREFDVLKKLEPVAFGGGVLRNKSFSDNTPPSRSFGDNIPPSKSFSDNTPPSKSFIAGLNTGGGTDYREIKSSPNAVFAVALFDFFDKGAYKAKWTKELFSKLTDTKGVSGDGGLGLKLGALAAVAAFAGYEIYKLVGTVKEFNQVRKDATESVKKFEVKEEKGRDKYIQTKLSDIGTMNISDEDRRKKKAKLFKIEGRDWLKSKEAYEKGLTTPEEKLVNEWKTGSKSIFSDKTAEPPKIRPVIKGNVDKSSLAANTKTINDEINIAIKKQNDKLSESIDGLSESVRKNKESLSMRTTGIKSVYDSADPLINMHSSGRLTMGD